MHPPWATLEPDPYSEHSSIVGTEWDPGMSFNPWVGPVFQDLQNSVNGCESIADI